MFNMQFNPFFFILCKKNISHGDWRDMSGVDKQAESVTCEKLCEIFMKISWKITPSWSRLLHSIFFTTTLPPFVCIRQIFLLDNLLDLLCALCEKWLLQGTREISGGYSIGFITSMLHFCYYVQLIPYSFEKAHLN